MAAKRKPETQAGEMQPATKKPAPQKKTTKTKTTKEEPNSTAPSEPAPDDFDVYQSWVKEAIGDDISEFSDNLIVEDWNEFEAEGMADFAKAARGYNDAKEARTAADSKLLNAANATLNLPDLEAGKRVSYRGLFAEAKKHHVVLKKALEDRAAVNQNVRTHLAALGGALNARSEGTFQQYLRDHQQGLQRTVEAERSQDEGWRGMWTDCSATEWNRDMVGTLRMLAEAIRDALERSPPSSNDSVQASPKGGSEPENEDVESEASNVANGGAKSPIGSARAGAEPSTQLHTGLSNDQAASGGRDTQLQAGEQRPNTGTSNGQVKSGDQTSEDDQASIRPSNERAPSSNQDVHFQPEDQRPAADFERLPLPTTGNLGRWTLWLEQMQKESSPSFISWCHRQLESAEDRSPDAVETLATAFAAFYYHVLRDHDWENEGNVPFLPFGSENFKLGWPAERLLPNFRRLLRMTEAGSEACKYYVDRHMYDGNDLREGADEYAGRIIEFIKEHGVQLDWDAVPDSEGLKTSVKYTAAMEFEGLLNRVGAWNYQYIVGEGGNGRAVLFVKYNEHGQVMQRIVSKECFVGTLWNSPGVWYGAVNNRMPLEAALHRLMPTHHHIIEYLGYNVNKRFRMIRLYTAYAELGDLLQLIASHAELEHMLDESGESLKAKARVPNLAVLYLFEAMAAGVCMMAHGAIPNDQGHLPDDGGDGDEPLKPWKHNIIHKDIKPNNYFLSGSSSDVIWPGLPVAALGDFGNGIDLVDYENDPMSDDTRGGGTINFMAPEQPYGVAHLHPVTSATNVYQVGLAILHVMTRTFPRYQPDHLKHDEALFERDVDEDYDPKLVRLARLCVEMVPGKRPSPKKLYLDLRALAMAYPPTAGGHGVPYQFRRLDPNERVRTAPDHYAHLLV